jgi:hypothetical protein
MSREKKKDVSRRKFLKDGAGAAAAVGCFTATGLREALALAATSGKPLLTDHNVNTRIPSIKNAAVFRRWVEEVKRAPKVYIKKHFYLTAHQLQELDSWDTANIEDLKAALDRCVREKKGVKVNFGRRPAANLSADPSPLGPRLVHASLRRKMSLRFSWNGYCEIGKG